MLLLLFLWLFFLSRNLFLFGVCLAFPFATLIYFPFLNLNISHFSFLGEEEKHKECFEGYYTKTSTYH